MWYSETERKQLDMSKPIYATNTDKSSTYLLIRTNESDSYVFRGYDWMNIATGEMNSCKNWRTIEEALSVFSSDNIHNGRISIKEV